MKSIDKLTEGFKNFRDGRFEKERATYETLVDEGQRPEVALIACADSRVDPAKLLQADPGDLFIVRNVANLVPPYERDGKFHGTSAALEFSVQHLEVKHLIVLGHAHCGGIMSMFAKPADGVETDGTHFVAPWMSLVKSAFLRVQGTMPDATDEEKARVCEKSAVMVSLENLMTFPDIQERVADGRLRLHGWYIDIRSCTLQIFDPVQQKFDPVE
ncbi:MAG: carbonic anhydrase [Rhodospirillaceae bacterium]|jgi:carbonic anhydrase|nr:carbonic anhydrase [Rhodospirillaceae bacterium]MBT5300449.1 carbonic anhydrase [Rhodospirillaceae bacterium]MBT5515923.1 carbonic anhydrase [Rhodospirillaceae bacterium]MBT6086088.1 carbonic anhydrase [Rhodospirillaceae bacterium]MBT6607026.1 carbonic anhydrase [Rhodospirillaceae bacterium]